MLRDAVLADDPPTVLVQVALCGGRLQHLSQLPEKFPPDRKFLAYHRERISRNDGPNRRCGREEEVPGPLCCVVPTVVLLRLAIDQQTCP